jgi:chemotaxis protein MotB
MRRARRRHRPEEQESHERWLVSYADFITLLFAFFTTLYAISVMDAEKGERLVQSIRESFGQGVFQLSTSDPRLLDRFFASPIDLGGEAAPTHAQDTERARFELLEQRTRAMSTSETISEGISVRRTEEGLVISLADSHFFTSGSTQLADSAKASLQEVAKVLQDLPNHVRVEGHTDDLPVSSATFPSNWHLSASRAVEVVRHFEQIGIAPYRLSASGFADQRPLVSNTTPQGRRMNRRIDIVVLRTRMAEDDS